MRRIISKETPKLLRGQSSQTTNTASSAATDAATKTVWMRTRLTKALLSHVADTIGHSRTFRHILAKLFGQFGLFMFRSGHLVLTEVVWFHFFYMKFLAQESAVPAGAPNYWWKRLVPPIEFGAMHAILLQLAIIPLTMARHLLALLSKSPTVCQVIPFEHMTEFHIFIGYTFCGVIVLSVILFFTFFGKVCADFKAGRDPKNLCEKFTSEIMGTGYGILAATLIVLFSSYFRHRLRFEVFYALHHFVFAMFLLALLHTLDREFRDDSKVGRNRSQTFKWFTASLLIYFGDRIWTHYMAHRAVPVKCVNVVRDASVVALCLKKPQSFSFRSGQHAFIQIPGIDKTWHPFSISSEPSSLELKFLIEVKGPGSWTRQLADRGNAPGLEVNVMGGFGSSVSDLRAYSEVLAVGTGTGIVPMVSLMLARKRRLLMLDKNVWLEANDARQFQAEYNEMSHPQLSYLQLLWRLHHVRRQGRESVYLRQVQRQARRQLVHTCMDALTAVLILLELWLLGSTISWSKLPGGTPAGSPMGRSLGCITAAATALYGLLCLYRLANPKRFGRSFYSIMDVGVVGCMVYSTAAWWERDYSLQGEAYNTQGVRIFLSCWRIFWLWCMTPAMRHAQATSGSLSRDLLQENTFRLLWVCRSADLLLGTLPEINLMLEELRKGLRTTASGTRKFLGIELYCTDANIDKVKTLKHRLKGTMLQDFVHFGRPDLRQSILQIMRNQLADGLNNGVSKHQGARSLVTFCGSPAVSALCRQHIEEANLMADSLAYYNHKLVFREEFYGHVGGENSRAPSDARKTSLRASQEQEQEQDEELVVEI